MIVPASAQTELKEDQQFKVMLMNGKTGSGVAGKNITIVWLANDTGPEREHKQILTSDVNGMTIAHIPPGVDTAFFDSGPATLSDRVGPPYWTCRSGSYEANVREIVRVGHRT